MIRMLAACVFMAALSFLARKIAKQSTAAKLILVFDVLIIGYVSLKLLAFYAVYSLVCWLFTRLLIGEGRFRRALFVILCFGCTVPFLYARFAGIFDFLPRIFALVGIAYNMLKAIDALYYTYYSGEKVPFFAYMNYMLFFPTFTAGPIFRFRDFLKTWNEPLPMTGELVEKSLKRLIYGAFKKVVVYALVYKVIARVSVESHFYYSIIAAACSYFALWLDMSGYADMAIALGGFMGISVPENFKQPFRAPSFTQFWRNWHVSLTDWIREHIFVVLNGKKLSPAVGAVIGFITMMFMSMWHSFSTAFLVDGLFNGTLLAIENLFGLTTVNKRKVKKSYYIFRCAVVQCIFAVNTLFYTLDASQLQIVLRGFFKL